jgi:hypothetical protein
MSHYIYYKRETGAIIAVTHELNSNFGDSYIETDFDTYENFCEATYLFHDYFVLVTLTTAELVKKTTDKDENEYDNSIDYIVQTKAQPKNSIIIKQDTKTGSWQAKTTISSAKRKAYLETLRENLTKEIFVVEKNNPKILLDTLTINVSQLLEKNKYDVAIYNENISKRKDIMLLCSMTTENFVHIIG